MSKRIYVVEDNEREEIYLVRAGNQSQALKHIAQRFTVEVASQDGLVMLLNKGIKVQEAGDES
jgi:hypothetical protein